jgi:hypothetical protein
MSESNHKVTDERLCWLAMRDYCANRSRKRGVLGWLSLLAAASGSGRRTTARMANDAQHADQRGEMNDKMGDYAFAVDDAARTLSADERTHLRATGEVPDWFLADVERRYREIRGK